MLVFLCSWALAQSTLSVDPVHGPLFTVEAALAVAAPGDTIDIAPGTYTERVIVETNGLTLRGQSRDSVILRAGDPFWPGDGFLVADGVELRIESLTMSGGDAARALRARAAAVTLVRVDLRDGGMWGRGSLLYADVDSSLILRNVLVRAGHSGQGRGGLVGVDGVLDAAETRFVGGVSDRSGGALYCSPSSSCSVQDSEFVGNTAGDGGAVHLQGSPGPWRRNVYCMNDAVGGPGGLGRGGAAWSDVDVIHENAVFQGNRAQDAGGALYGSNGTVAVLNSDFLGNAAVGDGAAIAALPRVPVSVRSSLVAFSLGRAERTILSDPRGQSVEFSAFFDNGAMLPAQAALTVTNQGPDEASPHIQYEPGDCLATDVVPGRRSTLIDAGDPLVVDPDESRSDIGSTGGPWACNRKETPGNELDEDCDGIELCFADSDGDGYGEPQLGLVQSDDLDCGGEGEARSPDDICVGFDDALDCDRDGIPDGCDTPCRTLVSDEPLSSPDEVALDLMGGGGCSTGGAPGSSHHLAWALLAALLWGRRRP